jgi:SAM-dependent methyltransferase
MKTVVSLQDLLEFEIRPGSLLSEYQRLTEASVRAWPASVFHEVPCPACGSAAAHPAFERFGLAYRECGACGSVYLSPRPDERTLAEHAGNSPAAAFWRERVLPETSDARREKILLPRADWVHDGLAEYAPGATRVIELAPNGGEIPAGPVDAITAFETFDRAADPRGLVRAAHRALIPGGLLFATAPNINGFELQVLWDRARTIAPPDKINLLSIRGLKALFADGWEILEISTPAMFDVEAVRRAIEAEPSAPWPRVVRTLVLETDEQQRLELQEYLQRARLGSFARVLARKN